MRVNIMGYSALFLYIMKSCPCNVYPLTPHFYIVKLGFTGVYIIFLFLIHNIDRGYGSNIVKLGFTGVYIIFLFLIHNIDHGYGSNEYPQSMFWSKNKT